jgi:UDP-2,4-diacetamido-2,4,6-trideoxy-beta-L-altropyranose hydrolase
MSHRAVFRFDASAFIGGGHAYRCLTLARALADIGWEIIIASRKETFAIVAIADDFHIILLEGPADAEVAKIGAIVGSVDLLVVDHYHCDVVFEQAARRWTRRILAIDDLADRLHDCDFLLDQTHGRQTVDYSALVPQHCRLLLGADYALLRPQFAEARTQVIDRRRTGKISRILLAMGATDPDNLTGRALDGIKGLDIALAVDVVLGPAAPHLAAVRHQAKMMTDVRILTGVDDMAKLMATADLAVGAGGTTSWERCCLGLPTLLVVTANNQQLIACGLSDAGAAQILGWHENVKSMDIGRAILSMMESGDMMRAMALAAARVCDGQGVSRTLSELTL